MKYNIYFIKDGIKELMKKNVDGEQVRIFMTKLNREQIKCIELERIREEEER